MTDQTREQENESKLETKFTVADRRHLRLQSAALAVLAIGAVLTLMYVAKPVLIVILVSALLAFGLAPLADFGERRLRMPRALSSAMAICILMGVGYAVTWGGYAQAVDFVGQLPQYTDKMRDAALQFRLHAERLQKSTEQVLQAGAPQTQQSIIKVSDGGKSLTHWITQGAVSATELLLLVSFIPFNVYFMLSWREHVRMHTVMLFKLEDRHTAHTTMGLIAAMIRSFIVGNVVIGVITSILSAIVFGMLGVPYFGFVALLSGFLSLIPYLGVIAAILPPMAAGLGVLSGTQMLIVAATVLALHLISLNVLYPLVIGSRLQLNPLAVTLSLLFWGWLWGAMGLVLAVPLTAAMKIVFDHVGSLKAAGAWLGE